MGDPLRKKISLPQLNVPNLFSPRNSTQIESTKSTKSFRKPISTRKAQKQEFYDLDDIPEDEHVKQEKEKIRSIYFDNLKHQLDSQNELLDDEAILDAKETEMIDAEVIEKNHKIDNAIKKARKKLVVLKSDKVAKFEKKLKVFEKLNTYIDIKSTIQNLNGGMKPIKSTKTGLVPGMINGRMPNNPSRILRSQLFDDDEDPLESRRRKIHEMMKNQLNHIPNAEAAGPVFKRRGAKRHESYHTGLFKKMGGDTYKQIIEKTNEKLLELHETEAPINEEVDADQFYENLQDDLVNDRFDRPEVINIKLLDHDLRQLEAQRKWFDFQEQVEIDGKYYQDYKQRANKVINLLKKATKNIFNKVIQTKADNGKEKDVENVTKQIKESWKRNLNILVQSNKFHDLDMLDSTRKTLEEKIEHLKKHIEKLINSIPSNIIAPASSASSSTGRDDGDVINSNYIAANPELQHINHQINVVFKHFMNNYIDEVDSERHEYKVIKKELKRKINHLESGYQKELEILHPKDMDSIRTTLDSKSVFASFGNARRHISKKTLGVLNL